MSVAEELFAPRFPADTIDEFVLAPVAHTPDKPAVVERSASGRIETVSYRELAQRVEDYTKNLMDAGLQIGDRVVVESLTSASAIALLLACARLGAAFIPVDPETPDRRLESITDTTGPMLFLHPADRPRRSASHEVPTATFDADGIMFDHTPPARRGRRHKVVGTDTAYIIFTSGTTGRPKGVVMSHHSALAFYRGTQCFGAVAADDLVASTSPLAFDVALFDICVTLGTGATLVAVPRDFLRFPRRLLGFLHQTKATVVHGVPSVWRPLLRHEPEGVEELGEHLRGILFAGENFPLPELHHLRALLPQLRVINAFGATETVACSFAEVPNPLPKDAEAVSIGHDYPGAEILLIDEDGEPVNEPGIVGEMYIRCPSLFTGYWDDPAATRAVLVLDPLDPRSGQLVYRSGDLAYRGASGELYFRGRVDSMLKIRGNRIELGEIECRLAEHPAVRAAVALAINQPDGELALVAFVLASAAEVTTVDLVDLCKQTMPAYMVPKKIFFLDELPLTANGKANRTILAELATASGTVNSGNSGC
jgi:amino acid adenylation domain-containing protein